ncbi:MAG: hypothetical protein HJJLKODD_00804 [Phycisphaerae bacterium]|nr:hypothetical protein [Phycisphaerae bacterium]
MNSCDTHPTKASCRSMTTEQTRSGTLYTPRVDIVEQAEQLLLIADLPGVRAADVEIKYEKGELAIHGHVAERLSDQSRFVRREYGVGDFHRTFQIGEGIDTQQIEAEMRDGVLTVALPKTPQLRPRTIKVSG